MSEVRVIYVLVTRSFIKNTATEEPDTSANYRDVRKEVVHIDAVRSTNY